MPAQKSRVLSIKLPKPVAARLAALAKRTGRTKREIVLAAIERELEREGESGSMLDGIRDLVGCVRGGPPDLSTNKKYMEGFGRS